MRATWAPRDRSNPNPPITHYPTRRELEQRLAGYGQVNIVSADGQGWSARAVKR